MWPCVNGKSEFWGFYATGTLAKGLKKGNTTDYKSQREKDQDVFQLAKQSVQKSQDPSFSILGTFLMYQNRA